MLVFLSGGAHSTIALFHLVKLGGSETDDIRAIHFGTGENYMAASVIAVTARKCRVPLTVVFSDRDHKAPYTTMHDLAGLYALRASADAVDCIVGRPVCEDCWPWTENTRVPNTGRDVIYGTPFGDDTSSEDILRHGWRMGVDVVTALQVTETEDWEFEKAGLPYPPYLLDFFTDPKEFDTAFPEPILKRMPPVQPRQTFDSWLYEVWQVFNG